MKNLQKYFFEKTTLDLANQDKYRYLITKEKNLNNELRRINLEI